MIKGVLDQFINVLGSGEFETELEQLIEESKADGNDKLLIEIRSWCEMDVINFEEYYYNINVWGIGGISNLFKFFESSYSIERKEIEQNPYDALYPFVTACEEALKELNYRPVINDKISMIDVNNTEDLGLDNGIFATITIKI